ncbi:protein of unknown function [Mycolicibacterium canariasense]|uniref:DUF2752 domain-containing protein n=1 Tax=Mycolicibacterium canariasense TaxID=228230 RepID=A0A100W8H8_MYCCR|nr:DUF2752 domain-containing protein [Mycolicibacterium canariasense]MCV7212241.1 DUF2752 domain-containing protein [Mycolicibacterium canariasense]ORV02705.1 hypothetical protein AWB94_24930 [Mycolicibacterium canariasense]GAS93361.1 protein of unknown function [Mycolicibacterium canariasense]
MELKAPAPSKPVLIGTGVALAGSLAYVGLADPHKPGFLFPGCPFKLMTGLNCPACGGLRMTHDLLTGNIGAAVVDNVFLLVGLPLLLVWLVVRWRLGKRLMPVAATVTVVAAAAVWTVVRNWPGFPLVPTLSAG